MYSEDDQGGHHSPHRDLRVRMRRPVVVYHEGEDTGCTFVRLESLGRGGALLSCPEPVPIGARVDLAICLAGGVIRARARVLYHLPDEEGCGVGVEFVELPENSAELLRQLVPSDGEEGAGDGAPSPPG